MHAADAAPLPVLEGVSAEHFAREVQPLRKPVILRGQDLGPCVERWADLDYLLARTDPAQQARIHVTCQARMDFRAKNFKYAVLGLHDLLKRAARPPGQPLDAADAHFLSPSELYYLRAVGDDPRARQTVRFERDFPDLSADFRLPAGLVPDDKIFSSVLRVSSPGVQVWTHYDVMDNVYAQVVGRKRAVLWPPNQVDRLYLDGDKSRVVDIDQPDLDRFPRFAEARGVLVGQLQPGDLLFIPAMWFHNMRADDFGVAVNVFWRNLADKLYDAKDPYGNRDLLPAAKAQRMLDNVIKQLDELPPDLKDFYGRRLRARIEEKCLLKEEE